MIRVELDVMLVKGNTSVMEMSSRVGIAMESRRGLGEGKAKAVRFSTLDAICKALSCQPGDILIYEDSSAENEW